jgi:hypothetical protein
MIGTEIVQPGVFMYQIMNQVGIDGSTVGLLQNGLDLAIKTLAEYSTYRF